MPPASDAAPENTDAHPPPPNRPWRDLLSALLWLLGAELSVIVAAGVLGFFVGFAQAIAKQHGAQPWQPTPLAYDLAGMIALQSTVLLGALKRGRSVGHGDLAAGLGAGPIRRKRLVAVLACLMVAWVFVYIAIVIHFATIRGAVLTGVPPALAMPRSAGPILLAVRLATIAVLAPIAEELFFRGWLWTTLRCSWGVWATALCTGGLWLAMHAIDGPARALVLVPAAVSLSLARHFGGSVRASMVVHVANNTTAMLVQIAALSLVPH